MDKISSSAVRISALLLSLLLSPWSLNAQQSGLNRASNQTAPKPVEIASALPSAPEPVGAEGWSSSRAEAYISAAAPVMPFVAPQRGRESHRFWDRENRALFALTAGAAAADFCVTRANLASGGKELNPVTRIFSGSTPGLAANFALETGGVIGISYMFHKTGHHKLERLTSVINTSASLGAVSFGLAHR